MNGHVVTVEDVIVAAAETFGVTIDDLVGLRRREPLARYRVAAMIVARDTTGASYPTIAHAFGRADHTSALYACRQRRHELTARLVKRLSTSIATATSETAATPEFFEWVLQLRCPCGWHRTVGLADDADNTDLTVGRTTLEALRRRHHCTSRPVAAAV